MGLYPRISICVGSNSCGWVSPFQYGYWAWRNGIYCWVPREPWGWISFHYGRWVHTSNHGWAWVPPPRQGIIWNPGAVAWNISSSHVSWIPLAPGEIYYGRRDYGPQSVNITKSISTFIKMSIAMLESRMLL